MREQSWRPVSPSCVMDRLATRKDALNRQETYQYDPAGNLSQFTDRKNQITTFAYDALNRRTNASYQDGSLTAFTFDSVGRLSVAEDSTSGKLEFTYDGLDRLIKELTPQGMVNYGYDALGRRTTMTANGQAPVGYQYDAASRLTQVAQGSQVIGMGYDAAGRRTSLTYPNGTSTTYGYDAGSRLLSILHQGPAGVIESLAYTYDPAGNRISLTRMNGAATLLPAAVQAAYDSANEQIQFNSATPNLTYDANGNLQTQADASGTTTYQWDARNRLVGITFTATSGPGFTASFVYDARGRRVSKTINGITTAYQYDRRDIVVDIQGGAVLATYLRKLCLDEAYIRQTASGNEYYHADALGSVLQLTDQAGAIQTVYSYEPFGRTSVNGMSTNPFQYTGRESDGTGLYYFRARYYTPSLHRFLSEDPARIQGGINFYAYSHNTPLMLSDPLGLKPQDNRCERCAPSIGCVPSPCDPTQRPDPDCRLRTDPECFGTCYDLCLRRLFNAVVTACQHCVRLKNSYAVLGCELACSFGLAEAARKEGPRLCTDFCNNTTICKRIECKQ